jgi:hypothetical protein
MGHGRGGNCSAGSNQRDGGQRRNFSNNNDTRPPCQICYKIGHTVDRCWHRFEEAYEPEQKQAAVTTTLYNVDPNWYTNSRATDHITAELDKLTVHNKYQGGEQVHTTNDAGMEIKHLGKYVISTPCRHLLLNNVLHVPTIAKNLISVHHFTSDNNVFMEFHPWFFLIKDRDTKNTLLKGKCRNGLYPLPPSTFKCALGAIKPSLSRWHDRLGHATQTIVERVIKEFNLPCSFESDKESMCGPYQEGKSHQLPYPMSFSSSSQPLELIYSDVWGGAPEFVGRFK